MADLISVQSGNFTTAATWAQVDTNSKLDSEAGNTAVSTTNLDSSTFVLPASTTFTGIALKLAARAASPSGTFTVTLRDSTTSIDKASVTVNVSDLPASGLGWVYFKFAAGFTANGTDSYLVRVVCSATGSQVTLYRNATANNWSRRITNAAQGPPIAGSHLVIANSLTGAGASTAITVTMDNTATTSFGPTVSGGPPQGIVVSGGGTLTWGVAASTAYYLKWKGIMLVCGDGTVNVGSSGARIDATSSAVLEMDSVAALDTKIFVSTGGTFNGYGAIKTPYVTLAADMAAAATGVVTSSAAGWLAGDVVAFNPSGTATTHEQRVIATVVSTSSITLSTGVTFAHNSAAPYTGYVMNFTRNITFRGTTTTAANHGNLTIDTTATVHIEYAYFDIDKLGNGAGTIGSSCIDIKTTTGSSTFKGCCGVGVFAGTGNGGAYIMYVSGATSNNWTIDLCMYYNWNQRMFYWDSTTGTAWTITNCIAMHSTNDGFAAGSMGGTLNGLRAFTGGNGVNTVNDSSDSDYSATSFDSWELAYCTIGLLIGGNDQIQRQIMVFSNLKCYFNTTGISLSSITRKITINTCSIFGNTTQGILVNNAVRYLEINSGTIAGSSVIAQANGININPSTSLTSLVYLVLNNTTFGVTSGILSDHGTGDISLTVNSKTYTTLQVWANNCTFASATQFANFTYVDQQNQGDLIDRAGSFVRMQNYAQTAGDHRTFTPRGNIQLDTAIFHTASPSERLTPNTASYKLASGPQLAACGSGTARVFNAWIRTSTSTDAGGANYTGNAPRLMLQKNYSMGQQTTTNIALATHTATTGVWAQVSGTCTAALEDGVWEVYVDCDGTAGWVNVDDWSVS